jgi:hypothetical protein
MTTSTPTLAALSDRIAALERSNRRLRAVGWTIAVVAVGFATLAMGGDQIITVREVRLTDDSGKPRVLLSVRTGLSMVDAQGRARVVLNVDAEGPGLALYGETSQVGMIANVNRDGPALTLRDNKGHTRAMLAAIDQGPGLIFWNSNDEESAALISRESGGSLMLADAHGRSKWRAP